MRKRHGNGWLQVGYSDLILLDGSRHQFIKHNKDKWIDVFEITNGATGFNSTSHHICYVGGLSADLKKARDTRTPAQTASMIEIINEILAYKPDILIGGHNQVGKKSCPSVNIPVWLRSIGIPEKNILQLPLIVKV